VLGLSLNSKRAAVLVLAGLASIAAAPYRTQSFHSLPGLRPPAVLKSGHPGAGGEGDIFVDVHNAVSPGLMILSPTGQLIWFDQLSGREYGYDFEEQQYDGQPVLTYWQGGNSNGPGYDVILNSSYEQVATVQGANGWTSDEHDFEITPQGTALIVVQKNVPADLRSVGGPRHGMAHDMGIQEIQISTGQLLWQWDALRHVRLNETYSGKPGTSPYDFLHLNAVQQLPNGNLLVSARNTWTVYDLSKTTGRILWRLGGKRSSFKIGKGANFEWQHDAQMQPDGTITLLDNAAAGPSPNEAQSRALRIHLSFKARRAKLVREYISKPSLISPSQGSIQPLADGNVFVDWGYHPYFTEFGRGGRELFSMHFPSPIQTYRALRFAWAGQPATLPTAAAARATTGTRVWASWNGATDVAAWQVLAGPSPSELSEVGQFPASGFETSMWVWNTEPYFAVAAVQAQGQVLATSAPVRP
jgi:hypothetical protein